MKILLKNQETYIFNGSNTTKYFKLEKGTRQGDLISAYLFILVLEILFLCIKENKNIKGLNIYNDIFLYTAYADDTTFFLKDKASLIEVIKAFDIFSPFSGLKPKKSKYEVAGTGVLKGVKMALCGMKCINLRLNTVKILDVHFSYNTKSENDEKFLKQITSIEKVLKPWRIRNFKLEGKVTVFKALAISKIVHLALITNISVSTMKELNKILK